MTELEKMEKRWAELASKPKSEDEIKETLMLAKKLDFERSKELKPLFVQLNRVGLNIHSIWDLVNSKESYPEAIEILIKHLPENYHDKNKEGIVRALTVKEARGKAAKALIKEYELTPKEKDNSRWIIGNAIATTMTPDEKDWLISIVNDKSNNGSRRQLVIALGTIKSEETESTLLKLLDDEEVRPQAIRALGNMKSKKAKEKIQSFLISSDSITRLEAQKALKKIK